VPNSNTKHYELEKFVFVGKTVSLLERVDRILEYDVVETGPHNKGYYQGNSLYSRNGKPAG
jgi:hypothetical protein